MTSHPLHTVNSNYDPSTNQSERHSCRNLFPDEGHPSGNTSDLIIVSTRPARPKCQTCSTSDEQGNIGEDFVADSEAHTIDQPPGPDVNTSEDPFQPKHTSDPPNYTFWICISVVDVIVCCFMGVIALYFVLQSWKRWRNYNEMGARIFLKNVRGFIIFTTVFGALIWLITIPIVIVTVVNNSASNSTT